MNQWHEKTLGSIPKSQSLNVTLDTVSVGSKRLALDILTAKNSSVDWLWAEIQSARFLEFWKHLDPNIQFILVSSDIKSHLIALLEQGKLSSENISDTIYEWCELTQRMISFHLSNSKRTVLVPVNNRITLAYEALQNIQDELKITIDRNLSDESKKHCRFDLMQYIASQILVDYPEACEINRRLLSVFKIIEQPQDTPKHKQLKLAIDNLSYLSRKKEDNVDGTDDLVSMIKNEAADSRRLIAHETDVIILQERFSALAEQHGQSNAEADEKLETLQAENETLHDHLHNCQELLEKEIIRHRALSRKTQAQDLALANFACANPQHYYYEHLDITTETLDAKIRHEFSFTNIYLADSLLTRARIEILQSGDEVALRVFNSSSSWLVYSGGKLINEDFVCDPTPGNPYHKRNSELTSLSTTSWNRLVALVELLVKINEPTNSLSPGVTNEMRTLAEGCKRLLTRLKNWPPVARYDTLDLLGSIQTGLYQRVEIRIMNMVAGNYYWPYVYYNVATVESTENTFGMNPRLEFPESSPCTLDTWYPEVVDQRGARCELRFAQPNAVDVGAWNVMSDRDQVLIAALLSSFTQQFNYEKNHIRPSELVATKWTTLVQNMKSILARNIAQSVSDPISISNMANTKNND